MSAGPIVVLNAGSSSLKFALFETDIAPCRGLIEPLATGNATRPKCVLRDRDGHKLEELDIQAANHDEALHWLIQWIERTLTSEPSAFAHRVVHGGDDFYAATRVDQHVLNALERLTPLAPLHQPHNLAPIRFLLEHRPNIPQVASFDTAFHATQDPLERPMPIPLDYFKQGIKRYGFHGHSFQSIASQLPAIDAGAASGRTVVLHLGNGASGCAMRGCRSAATTMGLSTLDGLMMGTRSGSIDPGLILHLLQQQSMSPEGVADLLYRRSGLFGVSGISSDMRDLLASAKPAAKFAIDLFCHQAAKHIASLAAAVGGLDALVFTAGIGENAPQIRKNICARAAWLGLELDETANEQANTFLHTQNSRVHILVVKTNEERIIAENAKTALGQ